MNGEPLQFWRKIEKPENAVKTIKIYALIFMAVRTFELIMSIFLPHIRYPALINLTLGSGLYFINSTSVGIVIFLWSLVPVIGEITFKMTFLEVCHAFLAMGLAVIGCRAYLATKKLHRLLFPEEYEVGEATEKETQSKKAKLN